LTPSTQRQSSSVLFQLGTVPAPTPAFVADDVHRAVPAGRLGGERVDLLRFRDVGHHRVHVRAGIPEGARGERERLLLHVAQHHAHAGLHEGLAHAAPDAAGGPGDHRDLPLHVLHGDLLDAIRRGR
jgi:hypothetical protein